MTKSLEDYLLDFDGKAVSILSEARAAYRNNPDFISHIIGFCIDDRAHISDGATWILKAEADDGHCFSAAMLAPIIENLTELTSWSAQLHVCQAIEAFDLTPIQADIFFDWAQGLFDQPRPFNRAWALHAMVVIANDQAKFQTKAKKALAKAEKDDAGSVRARARNLKNTMCF